MGRFHAIVGCLVLALSPAAVRADAGNPPPPVRVMALGDSITWGFGSASNGGYRYPLFDRLEHSGANFSVVGRYADGPQGFDQPWHEGHSGSTIRALNQQWMPSAMQAYHPDVTLLMIGTNDNWHGTGLDAPANAITNLNNLIGNIYAFAPSTHIMLASLPRIWDGHTGEEYETVRDYNAQLPAVVAQWAAQGRRISFVDVYPHVGIEDLYDGVHPNDSGYNRIADAFFNVMQAEGYVPEPTLGLPLLVAASVLRRRRA